MAWFLFGVEVASNAGQSLQNRDFPFLASRGSGDSIQLLYTRAMERDDAEWTSYGIGWLTGDLSFRIMGSPNNFRILEVVMLPQAELQPAMVRLHLLVVLVVLVQ